MPRGPTSACVIHTHSWASMAVSSLDCGLLPLTQTAMRFLKIGYHDYQGVVLKTEEQASLLADLGDRRGRDLPQPRRAGRGRAASAKPSTGCTGWNWPAVPRSAPCPATRHFSRVPQHVLEETWNNYQPGTRRPYGLMEWPALLRKLDRMDPSFRT